MRRLRAAVTLSAAIAYNSAVFAQEPVRHLAYLMTLEGTCSELVIEDSHKGCQGTLIHTDYDDGRIGFYFVANEPGGEIITFSGRGQEQLAPSENTRIQPIDAVVLSGGLVRLSGECLFENPYQGPARIECVAKTPSGVEYVGRFLTDGTEPRLVEMDNGNE